MVKRLRHRPFTAVTRVRVSVGSPGKTALNGRFFVCSGGLAQLVRASALQAGGRWFKSDSLHHRSRKANFAAPCTESAGCLHQRLRLLFRSQSSVSLLRSRIVRSASRPLSLPRENFARGAASPQNQGRTLRPFCVPRPRLGLMLPRGGRVLLCEGGREKFFLLCARVWYIIITERQI